MLRLRCYRDVSPTPTHARPALPVEFIEIRSVSVRGMLGGLTVWYSLGDFTRVSCVHTRTTSLSTVYADNVCRNYIDKI